MRRVLVVGFGNMGCRHVQSLLEVGGYDITVIEPSNEMIQRNCLRINVDISRINFFEKLEDVVSDFDLCIVATSAGPRFEIVKHLIGYGVKYFLLEKVIFQSIDQFKEVIELSEKKGAILYGNFVNRYFSLYRKMRDLIAPSSTPIKMAIYGGNFGVGCNAIHYLDLLCYLTNRNDAFSCNFNKLNESENGNKRGLIYKEFHGEFIATNLNGDEISVIADSSFLGGNLININCSHFTAIISEQSQKGYINSNGHLADYNFDIIPTSRLTATILDDIFARNCVLPTIQESMNTHSLIFEVINFHLFGTHNSSIETPIT